ncbi:hypothetical protein [Actinoplanes utahensis]|uniref:hypothetical protein n=1 Tax=Actinoplanes utahensis TaxID=1869 RepID=UPI0006924FDE|nr:hypothetical protein [Actinoplanes utahensis]GIF29216.1 hypothetical protein Aut01nite_22020 [Actinoplanes utahensis]
MTGNVPQPGETPRSQGNPWTLPDPDVAWGRNDDRDGPVMDGLPIVARAAGARDLTEHLADERLATANELMIIDVEPVPAPAAEPEAAEPQTARLERMENHPFWLSEEERAATEVAVVDRPPGRRRRRPARNPLPALLSLVLLSLVAAFFGWVSAEPFWLAVGHGDTGYATTTRCHGDGLTQRCTGRFATTDGDFAVSRVTLLGIAGPAREPGSISPARMVSPASTQAYTAPAGPLMHLRWGLGFLLVLICGYGIAETTGARRLPPRARRTAVIASFLGPLLLLGGFLAAAY